MPVPPVGCPPLLIGGGGCWLCCCAFPNCVVDSAIIKTNVNLLDITVPFNVSVFLLYLAALRRQRHSYPPQLTPLPQQCSKTGRYLTQKQKKPERAETARVVVLGTEDESIPFRDNVRR